LVEGIFFKFAIDAFGVYGGDDFAMKAAGHELNGLKAYYSVNPDVKAEPGALKASCCTEVTFIPF